MISSSLRRLGRALASPWPERNVVVCVGVLANALLLVRQLWVADVALLATLLATPGWLALRTLRGPVDDVVAVIYVACLSLLVLMVAGLASDLVGLWLGFEGLRVLPLVVAVDAISALLAISASRAMHDQPLAVRLPATRWPLVFCVLPLAAAGGAVALTNGRGNTVALGACCLTIVLLAGVLAIADRLTARTLALLIYMASLALMWQFSLRGQSVYGFDIATELHIAESVRNAGVWHTANHGNAYEAMLSVSVLPATISVLTGFSPLILFKLVYPLLFALYPVALYRIAVHFLRPTYSYVAVLFMVGQSWFFDELPAIARQEIGLLFFAGLILALAEREMSKRAQGTLVVLVGVGMVFSHYSTTYFAIAVLLLVLIVESGVSLLRRRRSWTSPAVVSLFVIVGGAGLWYAVVTGSTSNLSGFSSTLLKSGPHFLPSTSSHESVVDRYLSGTTSPEVSAVVFEKAAAAQYAREHPSIHPIKAANSKKYRLIGFQTSRPASEAVIRLSDLTDLITEIGYLFAVVGTFLIALTAVRRQDQQLGFLAALSVATLLAVGFLRLSGTAAQAYNQQRGFVQTMMPLAVCIAWTIQVLVDGSRIPKLGFRIGALVPVLVVASTSSLFSVLVQGTGLTNLEGSGVDVERFLPQQAELAAALWTDDAAREAPVYTDAYGYLRMEAATGRPRSLFQVIAPGTVDRGAWIYARSANFTIGYTEGSLSNGERSVYAWPNFIPAFFDLVYDNGVAGVYHR